MFWVPDSWPHWIPPHEFCLKPRHENYKNVFWLCSRFSSPYLLFTLSTLLFKHWVVTLLLSISTKFPFLLDSIWQWEAQLRDQRKKYTLDIYSLSCLPVDPGTDTSWFFLMRVTSSAAVTPPTTLLNGSGNCPAGTSTRMLNHAVWVPLALTTVCK